MSKYPNSLRPSDRYASTSLKRETSNQVSAPLEGLREAVGSYKPLISVIVPTKNEEANIGRLIQSIISSPDYTPELVEIIVVDNPGTTDNTRSIVKQWEFINLHIQGPERSPQRNYGAKMASGQYLYFVDADMEFNPTLLGSIIKNLSPDKALIIPEQIPGKSIYCRAINLEKQIYKDNSKISAARIFGKSKFLEIGGYDVSMVSGEDWDLDRRLQSKGLQISFLDDYILHNEQDLNFWTSITKKIYYAKKLKNYQVGIQTEVNPFYRIGILFSKPKLIVENVITWFYLIALKFTQFGVGFVVYKLPN